MAKLQYDPLNPSATVLREAVFARIRAGWSQVERADYNGRTLRERFDGVLDFQLPPTPVPNWESKFLESIYSLMWELVSEGIIRPGGACASLEFPDFALTEYGKRMIVNQSAHPHDIDRFLEQMRCGQPIDQTIEAYLIESLHSFRQNRLVASAILMGVAAERMFLLITDSLLTALKDPNEQAKLKKLLDRQPMKPKQDWVHAKLLKLDQDRRIIPSGFPESTPLMFTGIYDLIRQQRNDLGHPRSVPPNMDRGQIEANLLLFSKYYRTATQLLSYLLSNKASL